MPDDSNSPNTCVGAMAPDASTSPVDWSRPIEAVHEDGSVIKAYHTGTMVAGDQSRWVKAVFDDGSTGHWFNPNGNANHTRWCIRNVHPTTPELDPALWDRMVRAIHAYAGGYETIITSGKSIHAELLSLAADLPKPVDPDEQYAADLIAAQGWRYQGPIGEAAVLSMIATAHRDGRELAGEQA